MHSSPPPLQSLNRQELAQPRAGKQCLGLLKGWGGRLSGLCHCLHAAVFSPRKAANKSAISLGNAASKRRVSPLTGCSKPSTAACSAWRENAAQAATAAAGSAPTDSPVAVDDPIAPWRPAMYAATGAMKRSHPEDYRDRWEDAASLAAAREQLADMEKVIVNGRAAGGANGAPAAVVAKQRAQ